MRKWLVVIEFLEGDGTKNVDYTLARSEDMNNEQVKDKVRTRFLTKYPDIHYTDIKVINFTKLDCITVGGVMETPWQEW